MLNFTKKSFIHSIKADFLISCDKTTHHVLMNRQNIWVHNVSYLFVKITIQEYPLHKFKKSIQFLIFYLKIEETYSSVLVLIACLSDPLLGQTMKACNFRIEG